MKKKQFKRDLPRSVTKRCECSRAAIRFLGSEGICAVCAARQQERDQVFRRMRPKTAARWNEPEPQDGGAKFWKKKLEFWLPNPTPGWGSLGMLEAKLATLNNRVAV